MSKMKTNQKLTKQMAYDAIARNLVEFGYPDATGQMIRDTANAMAEGKSEEELPHGIIGRFAERQLQEHAERIATMAD